ncbi:MAG TPA: peptidoglycan-binding domain-containing protein [Streptosporangiaceae bacterium]|nr:peptidoglycan-binding domain-containing protein [Streptosporangiaceae bacterium]
MSTIIMFDATDLAQIPVGPAAAAGYVDGRWPTYAALAARFPHARLLSIAVSAEHDADCLDVETGDAAPADVPGWYARQRGRGIERPCLYASAGLMQSGVIPALRIAGIPRAAVRLWTAHYAGRHICGPASCGELGIDADGTQHTDRAYGRDLDQSLLLADFFAVPAPQPAPVPQPVPSPAPVPDWQEVMLQALPEVRQGDTGDHVRTVQGLLIARGHQVTVDGDFGPATHDAVAAAQHDHGVPADSVVGPVTWAVLATGAP